MERPRPVATAHLFPELLDGLLELLSTLPPEGWAAPVPRKTWTVHDVALHLLGGDVGLLSRERDGFVASTVVASDWAALVAGLKRLNDLWIDAGRRISLNALAGLIGQVISTYGP